MEQQAFKIKKNQKLTLPVEKACVLEIVRTGANNFIVRMKSPAEMAVGKEAHRVAGEEKPPQKKGIAYYHQKESDKK